MKRIVVLAVAFLMVASLGLAAEKTWNGTISDSMCGVKHKTSEHGGKKMSAAECVKVCVKEGAKYTFVSKGKVYNIENQDFANISDHAGHSIRLTGEMTGDSIKVSKIEMPKSHKTMKEPATKQ